jgi:CRP-like cAMP-binding protein
MQTIAELLQDVPAFRDLSEEWLELIAGCATNEHFADGEYLMREGTPADTFHVLRHGAVALETYVPNRGPLTLETIHEGDLLGWSWLVPPYRTAFDARAVGTTRTVAFDGRCLRGKCRAEPALGYDLLSRFLTVIVERLEATRVRLLDVYGHAAG